MPSVTVRNLPEEVHRAIRVRAARNGCSLEAEMRNILTSAVMPKQRVKLGSRLAEVGRKSGLPTRNSQCWRVLATDPQPGWQASNDPAGHKRCIGGHAAEPRPARDQLDRRAATGNTLSVVNFSRGVARRGGVAASRKEAGYLTGRPGARNPASIYGQGIVV